uniref:Calponin-homology (CH) domain-containing protein n=1 Tax=Trichobilharzia regenti TaxID=157069 RepID=A0AA85J797_TRIRE|nr:unnamed protein product [Trichobilharzia regenti]
MLQEPILHLSSEKENLNSAFLPTITHPKKKTDKSNTEDTKSFYKIPTQDKKMPGISTLPRTHGHFRSGSTNTDSVFVHPNSQVSCKVRAADEPTLKKSSSYQNIKIANSGKNQTSMHLSNLQATQQSKKRNMNSKQKHHGSVANIPTVCSKNTELTSSEPHFQTHLNTQSNAHRISVNSDLLSRVEREKKQYEARISELTQVTETRKMEIEKLTFEVRRAKEEASKALLMVEDAKLENAQLRNQLLALGSPCKKDGDQGCTVETHQNPKQNSINPTSRKPFTYTSSPPESLGTTTRLTPGGATTVLTGAVTASSRSSEWNDTATGFDLCSAEDPVTYSANYPSDLESLRGNRSQSENAVVSVATLQGRLLQMEEANYTTNEELQATLQELWDLQRSVDEAHEEAHSLAFERAILLEALATQTSKLEHCRFQIEQLKHLLLTDRSAQTLGTRENHFCELYASIEQEKQVLLGQNNDLAQSSESLARECRILTEKASALQDSYDALEAEHHSLEKVYQSVFSELNSLKCKVSTECHRCSISKQDDASSQRKEVSVAIQTDSFFFTDSARSQQSPAINENQKKFNEITSELHKIKEKYEILLCDREREQTEWRLYERDLLKAVQVADGIKTESELESRRLNSENLSLKEQVEKLTKESNQLNSEIRQLKDKINLLSSSKKPDTEHSVVDNHQSSRLDKQCIGSASFPSSVTNQSVLSTIAQNVCANASTTSTTSSSTYLTTNNTPSSCRLTPGTITDSTYPGRSSIMHSYSTHRPSGFNHASHLHPTYPGSPGAPGRPSALSTGPTVRSLIQSIENQVKAVQHQKRSTSSVSVNSTRPARLYTNSTNNGTANNRQNASQCLTLMSPIGYPGKSNNTSIGGACGAAGGVGVNANSNGTNSSSSSSNNVGSNNIVGSMATPKSRTTITDPVIPSEINRKIKNQENTDLNLMHSSAPGGPSSSMLSSTNQNSMKKYSIDNNQRNLKTPLGTSTIMNSTGTTVFSNLNQFTKTDSKDVLLRRNNSICGPNVKNNVVGNTVTESSNSTPSGGVHQSLSADNAPSNTILTNTQGSFDKNKHESSMHNKESPPRKLELISLRRFTSPTITDSNKSKVNHTTNLSANVNPYLNESDISTNSINEDLLSVEASADHANTSTSFHSSIHQVWQDPLQELARLTGAGSKRNALLRWCQSRVLGYPGVEVTNFSSSWNNGLAFCALLHTYVPSKIPWNDLVTSNGLPVDKRRCFETAFKVAESEGIPTTLQLQDMLTTERPDWSSIMTYITSIYRHYEVEALNPSSPTGTSTGIP